MVSYVGPVSPSGRKERIGILLVNLGTPDAPESHALRPYLRQFLWDPRVIEFPRVLWWLLLNLRVLVTRPARSAKLYKKIWTDAGSPLLVLSQRLRERLAQKLAKQFGPNICVRLGMRYGRPSIPQALEELRRSGVRKLLVLPLYPQYSGTSTASSMDAIFDVLKTWRLIPELRMVRDYYDNKYYINALAQSIEEFWKENGRASKLLMSFHGIPKSYVQKGDPYEEQCKFTVLLLAERLQLSQQEYLVSFQSRFGRAEWLTPYTNELLKVLSTQGVRSIDVVCPGFSVDCLETLEEINQQAREFFLRSGGETFRYIPALNDGEPFIEALSAIVAANFHGWMDVAPMAKELENKASGA